MGTVSADLSQQIINQAWTKAESLSGELVSRMDAARTAVSGSTSVGAATAPPITAIAEPNVNIPLEAEGPDLILFNQYNTEIINKLVVIFTDYITTYMPTNAALWSSAEGWINNQLANGGSGIKIAIENDIWQRDQTRILAEADRAILRLDAQWSNRGFPMPPGALVAAQLQITEGAQLEISKSSRERAIESFRMEAEMTKLAIGAAREARQLALSSANDYIRTMASSQQNTAQLLNSKAQAQNGLINAVAGMLNARANAAETIFKSQFSNAQLQQQAFNLSSELAQKDRAARGQVAVASAEQVARVTAAMVNNLHTSVGVQGTEKIG